MEATADFDDGGETDDHESNTDSTLVDGPTSEQDVAKTDKLNVLGRESPMAAIGSEQRDSSLTTEARVLSSRKGQRLRSGFGVSGSRMIVSV